MPRRATAPGRLLVGPKALPDLGLAARFRRAAWLLSLIGLASGEMAMDDGPFCSRCGAQPSTVNWAAIDSLGMELDKAVQRTDWPKAARLAEGYAARPDFNAHIGASIAEMLLPHGELLAASGRLIERAIAANSLENLAMIGPGNASAFKLRMDYARFHSLAALLYLKTGRLSLADSSMALAFSYMTGGVKPRAADLLRAGLISQTLGRADQAWDQVCQALLADTAVESADPAYGPALEALISAREGHPVELDAYLAALRQTQAQAAPDLALVRGDGTRFRLSERHGCVLFVAFFSPHCGSCRQALPGVQALRDRYAQPGQIEFVFILNQPDAREKALRLMAEVDLPSGEMVTLAQGNACDHIRGEPAVWIVDRAGRRVAQHAGYTAGDEAAYERELLAACSGAPDSR